jgi:hypothetical protein
MFTKSKAKKLPQEIPKVKEKLLTNPTNSFVFKSFAYKKPKINSAEVQYPPVTANPKILIIAK